MTVLFFYSLPFRKPLEKGIIGKFVKGDLIGFDYDNKKILIAKVQDKIFDVHFGYRYLEYLSTIDNNSNIIIASLTTEKKKK
jgi:hypothetical protein